MGKAGPRWPDRLEARRHEVLLSSTADRRVLLHVENLRNTPAATLPALTDDALRLHMERIAPACVADLFALAELPLPGSLSADLKNWAARATREIADLPDGSRREFLTAISELPIGTIPGRLRDAITALIPSSGPEVAAFVEDLAAKWADSEPDPVVLPVKKAVAKGAAADGAKKVTASGKPARAPRTPAAQVDTRRAEDIRNEALETLPRYERGLKESVFLAGIKHRSHFRDLTDAECLTELRRMERERKVKHTGDRWMMR